MNDTLTQDPPDDGSQEPRIVYQPLSLLGAPRLFPTPPDPTPPALHRLHRVKILHVSPPQIIVVEATPAAARDIQEIPGVKQIEPSPEDCDPDECGSVYFSVVLSMLYDARSIITQIEQFNTQDAMPEVYEVVEVPA